MRLLSQLTLLAFFVAPAACSSASSEDVSRSGSALSAGAALETFNGVTAHVYGGVCEDVYATSGTAVHYGLPGVLTDTCGYQCVELAVRYFDFDEGIPAGSWSVPAAIDMCANHPSGVVETSHPVVGDLMVYLANDAYYGTGSAGHVAVVRGVNANGTLNVFNQRWGSETTAFVNGILPSHAACFLHSVHDTGGGGGGGAASGAGASAGACTASEAAGASASGAHWWTCEDGAFRYLCDDANRKVSEACPGGCTSEGVGHDDQCNGGGQPQCSAAEVANQGGSGPSYWTCEGSSRYVCDGNGNKVSEACAAGCQPQGVGKDDLCACSGQLTGGAILGAGGSQTSCDGRFSLAMQGDGNLVLYQSGKALWATGTNGRGATYATMQADGNLVLYNASHGAVWASGTSGHAGAYLVAQDDGNVVIYAGHTPLWASNTAGK